MERTTKERAPEVSDESAPESIVLHYNINDLPTAQHKAGLAGLLLMLESMKRRRMGDVPEARNLASSSVDISITEDSLRRLFDDYYDAQKVETSSRSKWKDTEPLREEEIQVPNQKGTTHTERRYIYLTTQPKAAFLAALNGENEIWLKLYRDMVWNTLRSRPTTRNVYTARAEGQSQGESDKFWKGLKKECLARSAGKLVKLPISSAVFIGAQDVNAERVPFEDAPSHNLLLHFWPVGAMIFCPFTLSVKGERNDCGYVLAVPEPSDLICFTEDILDVLGGLNNAAYGYRPMDAIIDVPAEGGLEYIAAIARRDVAKKALGYSLAAVEFFHLEKRRNNVHMHSAQRIQPSPTTLAEYEVFKKNFRNPLFKQVWLMNLLSGDPWHAGFNSVMSLWPQEFFVFKSGGTPDRIPFFGHDARRAFRHIQEQVKTEGELHMDTENRDDALAVRVYDLVRTYVNIRTEEKCGIAYGDFKDKRDDRGNVMTPAPYREAKEKVCLDAFLAIRGRNDRDFVEYFAGTVCSVPQYLNKEGYLDVTRALFDDWEKVKTLCLLALSAASWSSKGSSTETNNK